MGKKVYAMTLALLIMLSITPVYADIGIPLEPEFSVVINIYGADYYNDFEGSTPAGTIAGGQKFYVYAEFEKQYYGSLKADVDVSTGEDLIYIDKSAVMSENDNISPEEGYKTESTVLAETEDVLNVRRGPGTGFKVIKTIDKGVEVQYDYAFDTDTTWVYVTTKDVSGWVSSDYLKTTGTAPVAESNDETEEADTGEAVAEEVPADQNETGASVAQQKSKYVLGIILICAGAAVLLSDLAYFLLSKKRI